MVNINILSTIVWTIGLILIILSLSYIILIFKRIKLIKRRKFYILFIFCIILILLAIASRWVRIIFFIDMPQEMLFLYKIIFTLSFLVLASSLLLIIFKSIYDKLMSQYRNLSKYYAYIKNKKRWNLEFTAIPNCYLVF